MINLHERMLLTSAGVEPATSWSPIGQRIQLSHRGLQDNWTFFSGEEAKNRFSRWLLLRPSWISHQNSFSYFLSRSHPDASYQVSSQLAFSFRRRSETDFQDGSHGGHLEFPMGMILAIFALQDYPMLPTFSSQLAFRFRRRS